VWSVLHSVHLNVSKATILKLILFITCIINVRERRITAVKDTDSVAGKVPLYPLDMKQRWEILLVSNLFSY
jgi:hypothetical protein